MFENFHTEILILKTEGSLSIDSRFKFYHFSGTFRKYCLKHTFLGLLNCMQINLLYPGICDLELCRKWKKSKNKQNQDSLSSHTDWWGQSPHAPMGVLFTFDLTLNCCRGDIHLITFSAFCFVINLDLPRLITRNVTAT